MISCPRRIRASPSRRTSSWPERRVIIVTRAASTVILTSSTWARAAARSGRALDGGLGLAQAGAGVHRLFLVAGGGEAGGFQLAAGDRAVGLGPGQGAVGFGHALVGGAAGVAGHLIGAGEIGEALLQAVMRLARAFGTRGDLFQIALQRRRGGSAAAGAGRRQRARLRRRRGSRPSARGRLRG